MVERLVEAARVVSRRREEGNVSGYDQARIELEAQLATSALATTNARRSALSVELALHLGVDERTHFVGSLALDAPPASPAAVRPSLKLSEASLAHAAEAGEGSSSTWIPTVAVSAGARRVVAEEARYGYVAGVSFALPFFSRGQGLAAQSVARRDHAQAVYSGAQRSAEIARAVAERLLQAAQQELERFGTATSERALRLEKAAEAGYREGQRSIVDLLDARRVGKDVEMRLVELALSAKQAELALRAAQGHFE
jgi:cobalt-zinc-cadmium efflux system outer membrane protein